MLTRAPGSAIVAVRATPRCAGPRARGTNDFLLGVVILSNPRLAPVMVAVNNLAGSYFVEWNIQMAGAVIAALPTIVFYLALGRLFMRGLLAGSLKG
jgi:glucose/mannose transport system permease protein